MQVKVILAVLLLFGSYQLWLKKNKERRLTVVAEEAFLRQAQLEDQRRKDLYKEYKEKNKNRKLRWKDERHRMMMERRANAPQLSAAKPRSLKKNDTKQLKKIAARIFRREYSSLKRQEQDDPEFSFEEVKAFNGYLVVGAFEQKLFPTMLEYTKPTNEPASMMFFADFMGEETNWDLDSSGLNARTIYQDQGGEQVLLMQGGISVQVVFKNQVYVNKTLTDVVVGNVFKRREKEASLKLAGDGEEEQDREPASAPESEGDISYEDMEKVGRFLLFDEKNNWSEADKKEIENISKAVLY